MAWQKIAIVTGANRGIGRLVTETLAETMPVLALSRRVTDFAAFTSNSAFPIHRLAVDLSDLSAVEQQVNSWLEDHPDAAVSKLILNAAQLSLGPLQDQKQHDMEAIFRTNVLSSIVIVSTIAKENRFAAGHSQITYLTSSLARAETNLTFAGIGLYSATKAAINRIAMVQAREFSLTAPHIRVARVHPGIVDTGMQEELRTLPEVDPLFVAKTAGLPAYKLGDWSTQMPSQAMRTITPAMAADFVVWASSRGDHTAKEFDYYFTDDYHAERDCRINLSSKTYGHARLQNRVGNAS